MKYTLVYTKQAMKDAKKLRGSSLETKTRKLLKMLANDPFQNPPSFEKLIGEMNGTFSRRINVQHRIVYQVSKKKKIVKILRLWTHYE